MVSSTLGAIDQDRLEAALEGGVLLDVLAVLVEGRGADAVQLAARQHRLEQVAGVGRALRSAPAPTMLCTSSMNSRMRPSLSLISLSTAFSRSSNSPRYLAPASSEPMSSEKTERSLSHSGTSPETMR